MAGMMNKTRGHLHGQTRDTCNRRRLLHFGGLTERQPRESRGDGGHRNWTRLCSCLTPMSALGQKLTSAD